jgi:hypothetical protein
LRLLTPAGAVHELTWGKPLDDGGTLIDVMGPSVSTDGTKIVFAGRRGDDHGHFRLYEIGVDGRGLRPLTGGPDDPGCTAVPPMRFAADGTTVLADAERRRVDYDDVDPVYADASNQLIAFASSRTPDLGRGHARRSTTLWLMHLDTGKKYPLTANRYNDRWPFLMTSNLLAFSLWSHNQEVITADEKDVRPHDPAAPGATAPADSWLGAFLQVGGGQFGALVKTARPVWRPRPLFDGRIVFMTSESPTEAGDVKSLLVQAAQSGSLHHVPSARPRHQALPAQERNWFRSPVIRDTKGDLITGWATPGPCPPNHVVLSAAPWHQDTQRPGSHGIYLSDPARWGDTDDTVTLLFDDPQLVDAEPVAVYSRHSKLWPSKPMPPPPEESKFAPLQLADGKMHHGPAGTIFNSTLYGLQVGDLPGQKTDTGAGPIFDAPPAGSMHSIRVYASRRDRFDDPFKLRSEGVWELLIDAPTNGESIGTRVPADVPTVLAGFDRSGKVVRWTTNAKDSEGKQATFYAFAGDHYSAARPMGKHFCIGCHPGHSSLSAADHRHAESRK